MMDRTQPLPGEVDRIAPVWRPEQVVRYVDSFVSNVSVSCEGNEVRAIARAIQYLELAREGGTLIEPEPRLPSGMSLSAAALALLRLRLAIAGRDLVQAGR